MIIRDRLGNYALCHKASLESMVIKKAHRAIIRHFTTTVLYFSQNYYFISLLCALFNTIFKTETVCVCKSFLIGSRRQGRL